MLFIALVITVIPFTPVGPVVVASPPPLCVVVLILASSVVAGIQKDNDKLNPVRGIVTMPIIFIILSTASSSASA